MKKDLTVVYEDNHLLVVNKPGGMLVQGDRTGDLTLLDHGKAFLKRKYDKPGNVFLGLPHRIDRVTSGLIVLCRTSKSLTRMTQAFREKKVTKTYLALVEGLPKQEQTLTHYLLKNQDKNKVSVLPESKKENGKKAQLQFTVRQSIGHNALLEVNLMTGRPHQIRVQLGHIGHPIVGDLKYGAREGKGRSIALHAWQIRFIHPTTKLWCSFSVLPPDDSLWRGIRIDPKKK